MFAVNSKFLSHAVIFECIYYTLRKLQTKEPVKERKEKRFIELVTVKKKVQKKLNSRKFSYQNNLSTVLFSD